MAAVLTEQTKKCYPEKWMSESFSNKEQIDICKQEVHDKVFGKFNEEQNKWRDSSMFLFHDCEAKAGNNVLAFSKCITDYEAAVLADNDRLSAMMKESYAKFM